MSLHAYISNYWIQPKMGTSEFCKILWCEYKNNKKETMQCKNEIVYWEVNTVIIP